MRLPRRFPVEDARHYTGLWGPSPASCRERRPYASDLNFGQTTSGSLRRNRRRWQGRSANTRSVTALLRASEPTCVVSMRPWLVSIGGPSFSRPPAIDDQRSARNRRGRVAGEVDDRPHQVLHPTNPVELRSGQRRTRWRLASSVRATLAFVGAQHGQGQSVYRPPKRARTLTPIVRGGPMTLLEATGKRNGVAAL